MPNWCNNSIDINGPTDKIKDLFEKAGQEDSGLLQAMVPMPSELNDTKRQVMVITGMIGE